MKRVANARKGHPLVRQAALSILSQAGVPQNDLLGEALAIGRWVQSNVRYVKDPVGVELLTDPLALLNHSQDSTAQGDCDDMALLIATLLLSVGISPHFRAVRYYKENGPYQHIYVVVPPSEVGQRVVLDGILSDPIGTEITHVNGKDYPL